ncbi:hypothetical protein [Arthrobacter sp. MMS24-S77]
MKMMPERKTPADLLNSKIPPWFRFLIGLQRRCYDFLCRSEWREHPVADLEAFGFYASGVSTLGIKASGLIAPMPRPSGGETVIERFAIASGPGTGAGAGASACLATFRPIGPVHITPLSSLQSWPMN